MTSGDPATGGTGSSRVLPVLRDGAGLSETAVREYVSAALAGLRLDGRSLCVVVPDSTRSCPLPLFLSALHDAVADRVSALTVLIALGTHPPMTGPQLEAHLGALPKATVRNHEWWDPAALVEIGTLSSETVREVTEGRLAESVRVRINRNVVAHDVALVVGPVFPHEVVGFSGGNKYFFPGVAGPEIIDLSHWLGALIGSGTIIGTGHTPVRALIDRAAALIPAERHCLASVVASGGSEVTALTFGTPERAWQQAAEVSARAHVRYLDAPVRRVVSLVSQRYDEIWTAAKGMYKVEPVVADGGEVVLYAPHVTELSRTHGEHIRAVGYHTMPYFTGQPERFDDVPRGVLAHSTHLRGQGTWDPERGESGRISVTLATGISERLTREVGLGYLDPAAVDIAAAERDPDTLVVPDAGEILYRLGTPALR